MKERYWILAALWLAVLIYWGIASVTASRAVSRNRSGIVVRLLVVAGLLALLRWVPAVRRLLRIHTTSPVLIVLGLVLCALGLMVAVWARVHLGRNWGTPMSVKQRPELVTTGPYGLVRHPIYSGMLVALLGSSLIGGVLWLVIFVFWGAFFVWAARAEERLLLEQFPDSYPDYRRRTKALVPFVY